MSMPMTEPLTQERRRRQTREHLLQAAAKVFAERGFHGASLDEVAATAGFTKGAVYSNFKNKEDLFLGVLEWQQETEMKNLRETLEGSDVPPEARLSDLVSFVKGGSDWEGEHFGSLYQEFCVYAMRNPEARARLAAFDEHVVDSVAQIIEEGRARVGIETDEPARHMARIVVALFRGVTAMRSLEPQSIDERFLETVLTFVTRGIQPPH